MTTATCPDRPLRKDAERSRQKILAAATSLVAEHGVDVSFDDLARSAGVGVGTVYRRFPTRNDLIEALFIDKVERLTGIADAAFGMDGDPWEALVWMCGQLLHQQHADRGLAEVLVSGTLGAGLLDRARAQLPAAAQRVLHRAQQAGQARMDVGAGDLAMITHLASRMQVGEGGTELARRYLALFLDALRVQPAGHPTLPGGPPSSHAVESVLHRP